ncbi:hypothetical protein BOX15_Mlig020493g1 [Macrostomum lignano]|uniref:Ribosomal protein eL8/eL30/eS12/Gadd45 domain-containing protein n=1 Tax=Macrostomum lignano TaxID=282301 RepID=A0A267E8F0_9PLAT|nr:hypothetical protein BOX15_Mlig020493g1 [Macrostomum lignano]
MTVLCAAQALEKWSAHLCMLASDGDKAAYTKLVEALCQRPLRPVCARLTRMASRARWSSAPAYLFAMWAHCQAMEFFGRLAE